MTVKRIAFISVHTSPLAPMGGNKTGGMNVYIRELSRQLGEMGYEIDIFTRRTSEIEPPVDHAIGANVRVIYLDAGPISRLTPDEHFPYLSEFTANLIAYTVTRSITYDVIYSHYWLSGWVAAKLKEAWGTPFVHMFHTLGHMKKRIVETAFYANDQRITTEKQIVVQADRLIAATEAERSQLLWLYHADRRKIHIIPPGVNLQHFQKVGTREDSLQAIGLEPDKKLLLFVGRIEPLKAVDTILEALHVIRETHPHLLRQLLFMIVGGDPASSQNEEMRRLQQLSTQLNIDHIVNFVGAKEQQVLPTYYAAATAVIMPSEYESFGMVALEAMATGTPVIASQVGGLAFLVRDKETGFLVPVREPRSLAECIITLLSDPEKSEQMGLSASRLAQDYAWSNIASKLIKVFLHIADGIPKKAFH